MDTAEVEASVAAGAETNGNTAKDASEVADTAAEGTFKRPALKPIGKRNSEAGTTTPAKAAELSAEKAAEDNEQEEEKNEDGKEADQQQDAPADGEQQQQQQQDAESDEHKLPVVPPVRTRVSPHRISGAKGLMSPINPDAELVRASDPLDEIRTSPVKVTDLSRQLIEQFEGGSGAVGGDLSSREGSLQTSRSQSGLALTQHDLVNTANVALVLQAGEFKLRPGIDTVPYEQLKELRLEDGLDVSRKEEYLSDAEFETVFGIDKEEFKNMPSWKRINAKKSKGLF